MPRYFFHINDGADSPDTEGTVLANTVAAHAQAVATAGAMLKEKGERLWDGPEWRMTVLARPRAATC